MTDAKFRMFVAKRERKYKENKESYTVVIF